MKLNILMKYLDFSTPQALLIDITDLTKVQAIVYLACNFMLIRHSFFRVKLKNCIADSAIDISDDISNVLMMIEGSLFAQKKIELTQKQLGYVKSQYHITEFITAYNIFFIEKTARIALYLPVLKNLTDMYVAVLTHEFLEKEQRFFFSEKTAREKIMTMQRNDFIFLFGRLK